MATTVSVPATFDTIKGEEFMPRESVKASNIAKVIANNNYIYGKHMPSMVLQIHRFRNEDGCETKSTTSNNQVLEYRIPADPDIQDIAFSALIRTENGTSTATCGIQAWEDNNNNTTDDSMYTSTSGAYAWKTGSTLTRNTSNGNNWIALRIILLSSVGTDFAYLKALHIRYSPVSTITMGKTTAGFVTLDSSQAAENKTLSLPMIKHLSNNPIQIRSTRQNSYCWCEDVDSANYASNSYREFTTTSTSWATVGRFLWNRTKDVDNIQWHIDGETTTGSAGTSKCRILMRPLGSESLDPDVAADMLAIPDSTGLTIDQTAVDWANVGGSTWQSDGTDMTEDVTSHTGLWDCLLQLKSDGTDHPAIKSIAYWGVVS